jgi:phosphohistidine phosphatase
MPVTLVLIRHGKSSWKDESLEDVERPLKKVFFFFFFVSFVSFYLLHLNLFQRGKADAHTIGAFLRDSGWNFGRWLSSHACRAFSTAKIVASELDVKKKQIVQSERLYFKGPEAILDVAQKEGTGDKMVIFSHNPDLNDFIERCGQSIDNLPTCGVAVITFDVTQWPDIAFDRVAQVQLHTPKQLRQ